MSTFLDNPVWASLTGLHASFASGNDRIKLYPSEMVPFAAVSEPGIVLDEQTLKANLGSHEYVYFVGTVPDVRSGRHSLITLDNILQMVRTAQSVPSADGTALHRLERTDVPAMLDLTGRVYPAYFRARTIEMGTYYGVFDGSKLVAMAGLRMAPGSYREISGVCTDPAYAGRGYARALCERLTQAVLSAGGDVMLHMDIDNHRARKLYETLGFEVRREIGLSRLERRQ